MVNFERHHEGSISYSLVPPVGLEPTHLAPEASALSTELRGRTLRWYQLLLGLNRPATSGFQKSA